MAWADKVRVTDSALADLAANPGVVEKNSAPGLLPLMEEGNPSLCSGLAPDYPRMGSNPYESLPGHMHYRLPHPASQQ